MLVALDGRLGLEDSLATAGADKGKRAGVLPVLHATPVHGPEDLIADSRMTPLAQGKLFQVNVDARQAMKPFNVIPLGHFSGEGAPRGIRSTDEILGVWTNNGIQVAKIGREKPIHVIITCGVEIGSIPIGFRQCSTRIIVSIHLAPQAHLFVIVHAATCLAFHFARLSAGMSRDAKTAMMSMTTSNSVRVNAQCIW